jgi:asparagine synthase (glutamine-hydrolysing)
MAGIVDEPLLQEMLFRMRHRGPDDSGMFFARGSTAAGRIALGNNRLSILDLSDAGHQPMSNEDQSIWVAYNGEIYNFRELRAELEADGHTFRSHTDTEVLPHLYETYGRAMVNRLNGMFAFAVWDARRQKLFLFRDRMGIKPLYYSQSGDHLYFASEIKALLASPEIDTELNPHALEKYLTLLYVPNPETLFKGIHKLQPGHWLVWEKGSANIECYWDLKFGPYYSASEEELAEELKRRLAASTKRQMISDVPIGFFLSGGIDSSALVASAAESCSDLSAYTISFTSQHGRLEQSSDDPGFARIVAQRFGVKLREIIVEPRVIDCLPKVVWHLDDPIADPACIATYLICQAAKPEVKVLLTGQGGDEIFGGYRVHLIERMTRKLRWIPRPLRGKLARDILRYIARHKEKLVGISPGLILAFARYFEKVLQVTDAEPREQYAFMRSYLHGEQLKELFSPDRGHRVAGEVFTQGFTELFEQCAAEDFVNQMLYVDAKTFLPDLNLAYSDKLSMACSIEARVPFLDGEVVDFALRVPPNLKIRGLTQKYLLKRAMRGVLPEAVIRRRKAGFGLPVRAWLRNELRDLVHDVLSEEKVRRRGLFDSGAVARMVRENHLGQRDYTLQIWALLTLEVWHQTFMDNRQIRQLALA